MIRELTIWQQEQRPACAVQGCREYPGVKMYNRRFCSTHAREFGRILSERYCEVFLQILRENRIHGQPKLYAHSAVHAFRPYEYECSVPGCPNNECVIAAPFFTDQRPDGWLCLCGSHRGFYDQMMEQDLGERLLWEWTSGDSVRGDRASEVAAKKGTSRRKASNRDRDLRQPSRLSDADVTRYQRIGREKIETLTNPELWTRFRIVERQLRRGQVKAKINYQAFRLSLNRIRRYHKLPLSSDLRKKVTNIGHSQSDQE